MYLFVLFLIIYFILILIDNIKAKDQKALSPLAACPIVYDFALIIATDMKKKH